ncbi:TrkH family potassium uptake protein [Butyrivibrio proteoclasticus]|uniref:TrkH family potassium uptake protein n=1 Tax=Butyrivibrio proteoclasticus TaxID=43305 RepID=UPI000552E152|nr:potassium transporter TrkG [Butyrivibrio proteoclasticus]
MKKLKLSPVQIIPGSFLLTILIGTILLMLPVSSAAGTWTDPLTALFTATTSVCVTGLVVVDTYAHWSFVGQLFIIILVQIGGLGMITVASMLMVVTKRKFSLTDRMLLQDSFNLNSNSKLLTFLVKVLKGTFLVEGVGTLLYAIKFVPEFGSDRGIWISIFNSISAFCNAGMDVIGPNSMGDYRSDPLVMTVTMLLIVMGGIGFVVWFDVMDRVKEGTKKGFNPIKIWTRLSEHTKLVVSFSFALIFGGMLIILIAEYNNPETIGNMGIGGKLVNSLFESITLRTAGFTTFSQSGLNNGSCLVAYVLMFIGGSPIGTAGGVKTVTMFLLIMNVRSYVRHQDAKVIFNRRVSEDSMRKASAVTFVGVVAVFILTILLSMVNPVPLEDALFEIVSACGTVGLSRGLTPSLNAWGKSLVIIAMYLGRIGPISLVAFFSGNSVDNNKLNYSEGTFYVG